MDERSDSLHPHPVNLGPGERGVSVALGALMLWRAAGVPVIGPFLLAVGGAALVWRGITGYCPVQQRLCEERRARPARPTAGDDTDAVTVASEDSFPASDPPSWTPVSGSTRRH